MTPDQFVWALYGRESFDPKGLAEQVTHQLAEMRPFALRLGGRIGREYPENNVSAFRRVRVGADLNGAVAAGGADELLIDQPARSLMNLLTRTPDDRVHRSRGLAGRRWIAVTGIASSARLRR
jgi:hypothetical protein